MAVVLEYETPDGVVAIEVEESPYGRTGGMFLPAAEDGEGRKVLRATEPLDAALGRVKALANSFARTIAGLDTRPDGATVDLALKFSAESGVVVASPGADTHLKLTLSWKSEKQDD